MKQVLSFGLQRAVCGAIFFGFLVSQSRAQLGLPPQISVQPTNQTVPVGGTATFSVKAYSLLPMTYKWYRNGLRISGADQSTYSNTNAQYPDAGNYLVEVSNLVGKDDSRTASLSLIYPPVKFESAEMTTNGFEMQLSGPAASNYVIDASVNLTDWLPISTNSATLGKVVFTDMTAKQRSMRFYRAWAR